MFSVLRVNIQGNRCSLYFITNILVVSVLRVNIQGNRCSSVGCNLSIIVKIPLTVTCSNHPLRVACTNARSEKDKASEIAE